MRNTQSGITVSAITLGDGTGCSEGRKVIITTGTGDTGTITGQLMEKNNNENKIDLTECLIESSTTITCSALGAKVDTPYVISILETNSGTYFDTTSITSTELTFKTNSLGVQDTLTPTINNDATSFSIQLSSSDVSIQKLYVKGEPNAELSCNKNDAELVCTPTNENMATDEQDYEILYSDSCSPPNIVSTGITVHKSTTITPSEISFDNDASCTFVEGPTTIKITLDKAPTGAISNVILNKKGDTSATFEFIECTVNSLTMTCTSATALTVDTYNLLSITGADSFTLTNVQTDLIYAKPILGENYNIIIKKTDLFIVQLASTATSETSLSLFSSSSATDDDKIVCGAVENDVTIRRCSPNANMESGNQYMIYYTDPCGQTEETGFTVTLQESFTISALELATSTCSTSAFTSIVVTVNENPTLAFTVTLENTENNDTTFDFTCSVTDNVKKTCSTPGTPTPGSYKIKSVVSETPASEGFTFTGVSSTILKYLPALGSITAAQNLDETHTTFTVALADASSDINIYLDDAGTKSVKCTKVGTTLTCNENNNMAEAKDYTIYYRDPCDGTIKTTGITVHRETAVPIKISITDINFENKKICTLTSFTKIILSIQDTPTGGITEASIKTETTSLKSTKCAYSATDKVITCTFDAPITAIGKYTLTEVKGESDIFVVDDAPTFELKTGGTILGTQTAAQTVNTETKTFSIILKEGITTAPKIYASNDDSAQVDCAASGTTLTCTPGDEMAESKDYTIYYEDECKNLSPAGVTVTYVGAGTKDPEVTNPDTDNGNYMMISRIIFGGLLVLIF